MNKERKCHCFCHACFTAWVHADSRVQALGIPYSNKRVPPCFRYTSCFFIAVLVPLQQLILTVISQICSFTAV